MDTTDAVGQPGREGVALANEMYPDRNNDADDENEHDEAEPRSESDDETENNMILWRCLQAWKETERTLMEMQEQLRTWRRQ
jgi:hypothetical protein